MAIIYNLSHPHRRDLCEQSTGLPRLSDADPSRTEYLRACYPEGTRAEPADGAAAERPAYVRRGDRWVRA